MMSICSIINIKIIIPRTITYIAKSNTNRMKNFTTILMDGKFIYCMVEDGVIQDPTLKIRSFCFYCTQS